MTPACVSTGVTSFPVPAEVWAERHLLPCCASHNRLRGRRRSRANQARADRRYDRSRFRRNLESIRLRPQSKAGHLFIHEWRPVAARPVRLQAAVEPDERSGLARIGPHGPAAHGDVGQPGDVAHGRLDLQVRPAWPVGGLGQRAVAPHRRGCRRALPDHVALHRGHQPRPGDHILSDRLDDCRPAVDGIVAQLWPRIRQSKPADVLRFDQPQASRPASLFPALGQWFSAVGTPGRAVSSGGRSGPLPRKSPRRDGRRPPEDARPAPRAPPDGVRQDARSGNPGPDRAVRNGLSNANLGARGDASFR